MGTRVIGKTHQTFRKLWDGVERIFCVGGGTDATGE